MPEIDALPLGLELDVLDTTQKLDLGTVWYDNVNEKMYRYVQNKSGAATIERGDVVEETSTVGVVTSDRSDVLSINVFAGVGDLVDITPSNFGWVQTDGAHASVKTNGDDDIAIGDNIIIDAATDKVVDSIAAGATLDEKTIGRARAADVDGTNRVDVLLQSRWKGT